MPIGLLERLNQRKQDLRSLKEQYPEDYAQRMTGAFDKTISGFGSRQSRLAAEQTAASRNVAMELAQQGAQSEQNQRLNSIHAQQQASLTKSQVEATHNLNSSMDFGNRKIVGALGEVVDELRKGFKDLKRSMAYGSSPFDLLGGPGGGKPKGPVKAGGVLGKAGRFLSKYGGALAAGAMGAYDAYSVLKDDTKTTDEKRHDVTNVVGSTAGAMAGASAGAALGSVIPGVGTLVGGVAGGALGYMGGGYVMDKSQDVAKDVGEWLSKSKAGDVIGRSAALVMSPFSEDARAALVSDYKNDILPAFNNVFGPVMGSIASFTDSMNKTMSDFWQGTKDITSNLTEAGSQMMGGARAAASAVWGGVKAAAVQVSKGEGTKAVQALKSSGSQAYGALTSAAAVSSGLARGRYNTDETKAIESLSAKGEKFRGGKGLTADTKSMIQEVAKAQGVDPRTMLAMAQLESGGNQNAVSSTGAAGLYQFTGGTAKQYKVGNRFDPRQNTEGAARLIKDNAAALQRAGFAPTTENIYLAHQQGAGGAIEILRAAQTGAPLSAKVAQNMGLNFGEMTAAQYLEKNRQKVAQADSAAQTVTYAGNYLDSAKPSSVMGTSVAMAEPSKAPKANTSVASPMMGGTSKSEHVATARQPSVQKVSTTVPEEIRPVAVMNPVEPAPEGKSKETVIRSSGPSESSIPALAEINPFFPDLSLVPIMTGKV